MPTSEPHRDLQRPDRGIGWKLSLFISFLLLGLAGAVLVWIFATEPTASRQAVRKQTAMLVEVTRPVQGTFRPTIIAMGTVLPEKDILLSPRVAGEIIGRSPDFTPGGVVEKGEVLLRIDPADYENALAQAESELHQAAADLQLEMGRQAVAEMDYKLLEETLSSANRSLVLRKPQLDTARAKVEAARAAVSQAELDLERTAIRAPFDAHILSRSANIGSQVAPGGQMARLVGLKTYWVSAAVPLAKLRWLSFPDASGEDPEGSPVQIRNRTAWPEGVYRSGRLDKLVGTLEEGTRMARVLVSVPDPFAREKAAQGLPPLMIGAFVEARIRGRAISDVVRLERDYIRKDKTVWVMTDGRLDIRRVEIVFQDADYAYIREGLSPSDRVVTTNLTTVVEGAGLRLRETEQ
jgi:RND family efflux transporter MFP subunit